VSISVRKIQKILNKQWLNAAEIKTHLARAHGRYETVISDVTLLKTLLDKALGERHQGPRRAADKFKRLRGREVPWDRD